jgi:hypothetical protein
MKKPTQSPVDGLHVANPPPLFQAKGLCERTGEAVSHAIFVDEDGELTHFDSRELA